MHLAHAGETAPFQARNQAQDFLLPSPLDVGLEAHEVVQRGGRVVLAELHHGVRTAPGARIPEADRPHGAEGQGVLAAAGQDLNRQAAFEVAFQVGIGLGQGVALGRLDRSHEGSVLVRIHGTVDVVPVGRPVLRLLPAVLAESHGHVDGVAVHNRCHRVEEVQFPFAGQGLDGLRQGLAGQRTRGDDGRSLGDAGDLLPSQVNQRMASDAGGDLRGEGFPVDGQGGAARQRVRTGGAHQQAAQQQQFPLEDAQGPVLQQGAHAVAADQFGQPVALVRRGAPDRTHFVQDHGPAPFRQLPGRLAACQAASDDRDRGWGWGHGSWFLRRLVRTGPAAGRPRSARASNRRLWPRPDRRPAATLRWGWRRR